MNGMNSPAGGPVSGRRIGGWVAALIVLILIIAAVWYYSSYGPARPAGEDATTRALETQGISDEIGAIEQDLDATDLGRLDQELRDIESQLAP